MRHEITSIFAITGRGTVIAIKEVTDLPVGKPLQATITRPDGSQISTVAFKEWLLLKTSPRAIEQEAYLLRNVEKSQVPDGCSVEVSVN